MKTALDKVVDLLDLEAIEVNIFRGRSPDENRQRIFGGQVAGQALVAAARTVDHTDPPRSVHSLHAYFLRPGDPKVPVLYDVDRIRDGRSFTTRRVVAIQHGRAIFQLAASFQIAEDGYEHLAPMPDVPAPETLLTREQTPQNPATNTKSPNTTGTTKQAVPYPDNNANNTTDNLHNTHNPNNTHNPANNTDNLHNTHNPSNTYNPNNTPNPAATNTGNNPNNTYNPNDLASHAQAVDVRYITASNPRHRTHPLPPHQQVWLRANGTLPDDPVLHTCLLTYASDLTLLDTTLVPHGTSNLRGGLMLASLDHAMWFHGPFRADEWLMYDQYTPAASGARGLATGRVFTRDGRLVASVVQEGLIRIIH